MKEQLGFQGKYIFESYDVLSGNKIDTTEYNVVTQLFFTRIFRFLNYSADFPAVDDLNLTHIAIGTGTVPAIKTDSALQTEIFRKTLASKIYNLNDFTSKISIGPTEGNPAGGYIKEIGCFAKATDTLNTGILVSRASVNIAKNSNIKLIISWVLTGV